MPIFRKKREITHEFIKINGYISLFFRNIGMFFVLNTGRAGIFTTLEGPMGH